jgi:hypothetical protein
MRWVAISHKREPATPAPQTKFRGEFRLHPSGALPGLTSKPDSCGMKQQRHEGQQDGSCEHREDEETPAGVRQEHDHGIGPGRWMHRARRHHGHDRHAHGEPERPGLRPAHVQKEQPDRGTDEVPQHDIRWLRERDLRVAEQQHARSTKRSEQQRKVQAGAHQRQGENPQKSPDARPADRGRPRIRRPRPLRAADAAKQWPHH